MWSNWTWKRKTQISAFKTCYQLFPHGEAIRQKLEHNIILIHGDNFFPLLPHETDYTSVTIQSIPKRPHKTFPLSNRGQKFAACSPTMANVTFSFNFFTTSSVILMLIVPCNNSKYIQKVKMLTKGEMLNLVEAWSIDWPLSCRI